MTEAEPQLSFDLATDMLLLKKHAARVRLVSGPDDATAIRVSGPASVVERLAATEQLWQGSTATSLEPMEDPNAPPSTLVPSERDVLVRQERWRTGPDAEASLPEITVSVPRQAAVTVIDCSVVHDDLTASTGVRPTTAIHLGPDQTAHVATAVGKDTELHVTPGATYSINGGPAESADGLIAASVVANRRPFMPLRVVPLDGGRAMVMQCPHENDLTFTTNGLSQVDFLRQAKQTWERRRGDEDDQLWQSETEAARAQLGHYRDALPVVDRSMTRIPLEQLRTPDPQSLMEERSVIPVELLIEAKEALAEHDESQELLNFKRWSELQEAKRQLLRFLEAAQFVNGANVLARDEQPTDVEHQTGVVTSRFSRPTGDLSLQELAELEAPAVLEGRVAEALVPRNELENCQLLETGGPDSRLIYHPDAQRNQPTFDHLLNAEGAVYHEHSEDPLRDIPETGPNRPIAAPDHPHTLRCRSLTAQLANSLLSLDSVQRATRVALMERLTGRYFGYIAPGDDTRKYGAGRLRIVSGDDALARDERPLEGPEILEDDLGEIGTPAQRWDPKRWHHSAVGNGEPFVRQATPQQIAEAATAPVINPESPVARLFDRVTSGELVSPEDLDQEHPLDLRTVKGFWGTGRLAQERVSAAATGSREPSTPRTDKPAAGSMHTTAGSSSTTSATYVESAPPSGAEVEDGDRRPPGPSASASPTGNPPPEMTIRGIRPRGPAEPPSDELTIGEPERRPERAPLRRWPHDGPPTGLPRFDPDPPRPGQRRERGPSPNDGFRL